MDDTQQISNKLLDEQFRKIVDSLGIGISLISPKMEVLFLNQQMQKWFPELKVEERPLCYQGFNNPPKDSICPWCPTVKSLQTGECHESVTETPTGDSITYFRLRSSPVFDEFGKIVAAIEMVEDISERERVNRALVERENRVSTLFEGVACGVIVIDLKTKEILEVNKPAIEMIGLEAEDILGRICHKFICTNCEGACPIADLGEVISNRPTVLLAGDGSRIPILKTAVEINVNGRDCILDSFTDISKLKEAEAKLLQSSKIESIGTLAAGVAHEINTPAQFVGDNMSFLSESYDKLTEVFGAFQQFLDHVEASGHEKERCAEFRELLQEKDVDFLFEEMPAAIKESLEGIRRVSEIVRAMKAFSHPGTGDKQPVDINEAIDNSIMVCRNEWKYVSTLDCELAPDLPKVLGFAGEISQVIVNLIVNAAQAMTDKQEHGPGNELGKITIITRHDDSWVEILIRDTGAGISDEARRKIFDPFLPPKKLVLALVKG